MHALLLQWDVEWSLLFVNGFHSFWRARNRLGQILSSAQTVRLRPTYEFAKHTLVQCPLLRTTSVKVLPIQRDLTTHPLPT